MFGRKRDKTNGKYRVLRNQGVCDLYRSPDLVKIMKFKRHD
jgi:hypothetical protein